MSSRHHSKAQTPGPKVAVPQEALAAFCRRHHIRRLALFGSVLREDFGPSSDVDLMVEFEPGHVPTLFGLVRMEEECFPLFEGRKVDMRTPQDLSRYFRDEVLGTAVVAYVP